MTEGLYEDAKKSVSDFPKYLSERLKLPIVILYLSLVTLFNWDIIFYLLFQKSSAICKIIYIKSRYSNLINLRLGWALFISIVSALTFPSIQIVLNWILSFVKRYELQRVKREEEDYAEHRKRILDIRTGNLERQGLQSKIEKLSIENQEILDSVESLMVEKKEKDIEINDLKSMMKSQASILEDQKKEFSYTMKKEVQSSKLISEMQSHTLNVLEKYLTPFDLSFRSIFRETVGILSEYGRLDYHECIKIAGESSKEYIDKLFDLLVLNGVAIPTNDSDEIIALTTYGKLFFEKHKL